MRAPHGSHTLRAAPLLLIEWIDSSGHHGGWANPKDLKPDIGRCRSVGWLWQETAESLTLVPHHTGDASTNPHEPESQDEFDGWFSIPKVAIVRRRTLLRGGQ